MDCEPFCTPLPWGAGGGAGGAGGLRQLFPAVSVPGIVRSERGVLPTCPLRAWQAMACKAWEVLRTDCVPRCSLPFLLWRGAWCVGARHPLQLPFLRGAAQLCKAGCCSFPPAAWNFGKEFSSLVIRGSGRFVELRWLLRCPSRGFAGCVWCSLDLFSRKLVSGKRTDWLACCGAGEQAQPFCRSQKRCSFGSWARCGVE